MNNQQRTNIARGQKSEVRSQRSEVRSQRSEIRLCRPSSVVRLPSSGLQSTAFSLQSAFTLVELLVVISIIALLLGIIVPSYFSIREKAKYTKAKVTVKNLETAFKAYLDHYRTWPAAFGAGAAHDIDEPVVKILRGDKSADNIDGIAFYEFESTNSTAGALDAWSNPSDPSSALMPYRFQVDHDYNNQITTAGGQILYRTVIVWSYGADRTNDTSDDVKSWD